MEYKIITATSESILEEAIKSLLKQGWKLQGGISITYNHGLGSTDFYFAQAVMK